MGKLGKLRSRFSFHMHKKDRLQTALRTPSHQLESSRQDPVDIPEEPHEELSPTLIPPQPAPQCSGHNRSTQQCPGGRLYWNEARRIYSDPIPVTSRSRAEAEGEGAGHREVPSSELTEVERANVSSVSGWEVEADEDNDPEEDDNDDVFLENCSEDLSGVNISTLRKCKSSSYYHQTRRHSSYKDFVSLQRSNGWTWPTTEVDCTAWEDWRISPKEVVVGSMVSCTSMETIYRGYWHGGVHIHTREAREVEDLVCFLEEVHTLSCIRHENIQLFMGACLNLNHQQPLALIMSELKGDSLYTRLHTYGHAFTNPSKVRILQQIAEGMAYLHAKQIPHGLLSSAYITLTCRVCISLAPRQSHTHPPRRSRTFYPQDLTYLPPEYIREMHVVCCDRSRTVQDIDDRQRGIRVESEGVVETSRNFRGCQVTRRRRWVPTISLWKRESSNSFAADVFAFGTIAYELMTLEFPYKHLPLECLIFRAGCGETQSLELISNRHFKTTISKCWNPIPQHRPSFKELVTSLEQNATVPHPGSGLKSSVSLPLLSGYC